MNRRLFLWRSIALCAISLGIAFACYQLTRPELPDYGLGYTINAKAAGEIVVTSVRPGSTAARAGIKPGDRVAFGNTQLERATTIYAVPGSRVQVLVNGSRAATLVAPPALHESAVWAPSIVRLAFLCVAALLAWRRFDDTASRALVAFLFCYGVTIGIRNNVLPTPLATLIVAQLVSTIFLLLGTGFAAIFAATFPSGRSKPLPGALARIAMAIAVMASGIAIASMWSSTANESAWFNFTILSAITLIALFVAFTLIVAYIHGAADERQRRRWVFLLLGLGLAAVAVDVGFTAAIGYNSTVDITTLLFVAGIPFGLAYVILRHRVIDVGFVLNRAVVYAGVSIVIVGVFVIVETLLGKYVENTSHVTSVAVQLAVALVLGFSIRFVHARVDGLVDNVLFRERHLAEAAIRDFAQEASYITDAGVLLARCVKTVERYARARGAGVWLADDRWYRANGAATFALAPDADENDPAVVAMRARRVNVHVRECDSALPGVLAFPMIVRGELLGILVVGAKVDDETYAPDEQDALASLASSVGHALDAIEVRELRRRLEALTATAGGQPAF